MVCVTHDDGSRALYVHLQNGSTTPLPLGSTMSKPVITSDALGVLAFRLDPTFTSNCKIHTGTP